MVIYRIVFKRVLLRSKRFTYIWGIIALNNCETNFTRYRTL